MLFSHRNTLQASKHVCDWVRISITSFLLESLDAKREKSKILYLDVSIGRTPLLELLNCLLKCVLWVILVEIKYMLFFLRKRNVFESLSHLFIVLFICWLSWFLECLLSGHCLLLLTQFVHYLSLYLIAWYWPYSEIMLFLCNKVQKWWLSSWRNGDWNENDYFLGFVFKRNILFFLRHVFWLFALKIHFWLYFLCIFFNIYGATVHNIQKLFLWNVFLD